MVGALRWPTRPSIPIDVDSPSVNARAGSPDESALLGGRPGRAVWAVPENLLRGWDAVLGWRAAPLRPSRFRSPSAPVRLPPQDRSSVQRQLRQPGSRSTIA